jgi:hypothetical protein
MSRHRAPRRAQESSPHRSRVRGGRSVLLVLAAVAGIAGIFGAGQSLLSAEPAPASAANGPTPANLVATPAWAAPDQRWSGVLARLDDRRTLAFSRADPGLLDRIYLPGSGLGARDARVIEAYSRRDLRVVGLRMTVLALRVEDQTATTAVLSVVDRISRARAVNSAGRSHALPRDRATAHRVTLRRVSAGWRIARINDR